MAPLEDGELPHKWTEGEINKIMQIFDGKFNSKYNPLRYHSSIDQQPCIIDRVEKKNFQAQQPPQTLLQTAQPYQTQGQHQNISIEPPVIGGNSQQQNHPGQTNKSLSLNQGPPLPPAPTNMVSGPQLGNLVKMYN